MPDAALEQWIEALQAERRGKEYRAACPLHDPDGSGNDDFDFHRKNGRIVVHCRVCGTSRQDDVHAAAVAKVKAKRTDALPHACATPQQIEANASRR